MKQTLEGIVLQKINYSESSLIVKLLTENEGVVSAIFQGGKSQKKGGNILSPLAIIQAEFYRRKDSELAKITQVDSSVVYKEIPFDPYKSSVVFFMNEVIHQAVHEKEDTRELYIFLKQILQILDLSDNTRNFPIKFLFELTRYLGFFPEMTENPNYFDLQEGAFTKYQPNHPFFLDEQKTLALITLSKTKFDGISEVKIDLTTRRALINDLLSYYRIIFDHFEEVQSLAVLEATLHD